MCMIHTDVLVSTPPMYLSADTHTLRSHHPPVSTKRRAGIPHAPPVLVHTGTCSHLLSMCPRIQSNCFQMQTVPLLLVLWSLWFLSIVLCLPSNLPGRSCSREKIKLPHLPPHTSYTAAKSHTQVTCSTDLWTFKL